MAENAWQCLEMSINGWKLPFVWLKIAANGQKELEIVGNGWKSQEIAGHGWI